MRRTIATAAAVVVAAIFAGAALAATATPFGGATTSGGILTLVSNTGDSDTANDFSGAMVSAQLLDADPETGEPIDYIAIAHELERKVRERIEREKVAVEVQAPVSVHMIGFAKVVGDVAEGALSVVTFAIVTVVLTLIFVWVYIQSFRIALVPVVSSLVASPKASATSSGVAPRWTSPTPLAVRGPAGPLASSVVVPPSPSSSSPQAARPSVAQ